MIRFARRFISLTFLVVVAYKPIYDAKEGAAIDATWQICYQEMMRVVPGLALGQVSVAV